MISPSMSTVCPPMKKLLWAVFAGLLLTVSQSYAKDQDTLPLKLGDTWGVFLNVESPDSCASVPTLLRSPADVDVLPIPAALSKTSFLCSRSRSSPAPEADLRACCGKVKYVIEQPIGIGNIE